MVRLARPAAGLVYAEGVGLRHLDKTIADDDARFEARQRFLAALEDYWTPERLSEVNRGIAFYRGVEGRTKVVDNAV